MKLQSYCVIKNNKIIRVYETTQGVDGIKASLKAESIDDFDSITEIPSDTAIQQGEDIRSYDENHQLRPLQDRIDDEIIVVGNDEKIVDGTIVKKSIFELIRDGIEKCPAGMKIETIDVSDQYPDGLMLRLKTLDEQVQDGEISAQRAYNIKLNDCHQNRKTAYINESDGLFFDWQRDEATKEEWLAKVAEIKERFPKPALLT
ncbi:MAG TPA: hypothetical protein P5295_10090 [Spirochaetota bacterium]|nr:hypothetical protein [Spirochaetota bacterium]